MAVALRFGRNLQSLEYTTDVTDRATRIGPLCARLGAKATYLGNSRWTVSNNASGVLTLADPGGGPGPVAFTDQFNNVSGDTWYVYREATARAYAITDSAPSPCTVTITGDPGIQVGEYVQFRRSATTGDPIAVGPGGLVSSLSRGYTLPLLATAKASNVLTIASYIGTPDLPTADDQYVADDVAFSNFVQTSTGDFTTSGGVDTWPHFVVTHVSGTNFSGLAVGDWCISGDLSVWEGSSGLGTSFPPLTVTAVNSSTEIEVAIRGKGPTFRQGAPSVPLQFFRPVAGNLTGTITDSSASAHTVTVDDATSLTASPSAPCALELSYAPVVGEIPYYLDHARYIDPDAVGGIGVKFGTIDRGDVIAAANLSPNAWVLHWTAGAPDGYALVGTGTSVTQNTDPLYTELGGSSAIVTLGSTNAEFQTPVIAWKAAYPGQRFSVRAHLQIPDQWSGNRILELRFGIVRSDGTRKTWRQPDAVLRMMPPDATGRTSDTATPAGGAWFDAVIPGFDLTTAAGLGDFSAVGQADLGDVVGYFVSIVNVSGAVMPFVFDGIAIVTGDEAPASLKDFGEFGQANRAWQDTNVALGLIGKPLPTITVDLIDVYRANPDSAAAIDKLELSSDILAHAPSVGLVNDEERVVWINRNLRYPKKTRITIGNLLAAFTDLFVHRTRAIAAATSSAIKAIQSVSPAGSGTATGGTTGTGTALPQIQLVIEIDDAGIPTITVVGDASITSVKIATSTSTFPTPTDVRAATAIDSPDPFVLVGSALSDGDTIKVAAFGYTDANVESGEATGSATYTAAGASPVDSIPLLAHDAVDDGRASLALGTNSAWTWNTSGGRGGSKPSVQINTAYADYHHRYFPASPPLKLGAGRLIDLNGLSFPATDYYPLCFAELDGGSNGGEFLAVAIEISSGKLVALRSDGYGTFSGGFYQETWTVLGSPSTYTFPTSGITHFEPHFYMHASAGYVKVWVEEVQVLNVTGVNTVASGSTGILDIKFGTYNDSSRRYNTKEFKSVSGMRLGEGQLLDTSALASEDDFAGKIQTDNRYATGDGTYTNGTATGAATKWDCLNDRGTTAAISSTDYVEMAADGDQYTATFPATSGVTTMLAVSVNHAVRHSQATGKKGLKTLIKSGGTTLTDTREVIVNASSFGDSDIYVGSAVNNQNLWFNTDPNTSAAWGVSAFDSAEFGFKQVAATTSNNASGLVRHTRLLVVYTYRA